jgi:hypothetical protein
VLVEPELHHDLELAGGEIVLVAGARHAPGIPTMPSSSPRSTRAA